MTVQKARELLGEKGKNLSDDEIHKIIVSFSEIASVIIQKLKNNDISTIDSERKV